MQIKKTNPKICAFEFLLFNKIRIEELEYINIYIYIYMHKNYKASIHVRSFMRKLFKTNNFS